MPTPNRASKPKVPSVTPLDGGQISVQTITEADLQQHHLEAFQDTLVDDCLGVAPIYGPRVTITTLALVSSTNALVIRFNAKKSGKAVLKKRKLLQDLILGNEAFNKFAFYMDKLAFALFRQFKIRVASAISILPPDPTHSFTFKVLSKAIKGSSANLTEAQLKELFQHEEGKKTRCEDSVRQAWLARHAGASPGRKSKDIVLDSSIQKEHHLAMASDLYCLAIELRELKPDVVRNEVDPKEFNVGKGHVDVISTRFKTRIMRIGEQQSLEVKIVDSDGRVSGLAARTKQVVGRGVQIVPSRSMASAVKIQSIKTLGRERPTTAEEARHKLLTLILKGTVTTLGNPFVKAIFFPNEPVNWPALPRRPDRRIVMTDPSMVLNNSQHKAVEGIISLEDRRRVVLIHGPPGTGKTTVIAASTSSIVYSDPKATVWLVAHSNVAVKNIAEKLAQSGFWDFKLVVSMDFHFDWHEHLYLKIEENVVRTDALFDDPVATERRFLGARVILSTTSNMITNAMATIARLVPVQTMIVDEASQIDVGDYLPALNRFQHTLQKLVFIGDDKQLAPYGREQIKELESIFEQEHLREDAILLDIQYRMPVPIGSFIAQHVYEGKLMTDHPLSSQKSCRFVDVRNSEEASRGHSWVNYKEASVVIAIARQLVSRGLAFRIITPYDPQRSFLENELKKENLPYEDKCFNVDSFQGNEADFIIVSLVRSGNKLGFLREDRRVNVMLTRCKKGMVIVTNRNFVQGVARDSLVGKLAESLEGNPWLDGNKVRFAGTLVF